jgi:hypothetical protein
MNATNGANLRASRKEHGALRAATRTPAKKAAPAKKQAATPKLRWSFPDGYDNRATTGQSASFNGGELAMKPHSGKWKATYTKSGKETVLAENVGAGAAYSACIAYSKGAVK